MQGYEDTRMGKFRGKKFQILISASFTQDGGNLAAYMDHDGEDDGAEAPAFEPKRKKHGADSLLDPETAESSSSLEGSNCSCKESKETRNSSML